MPLSTSRAARAAVLQHGFATVGIIALVDEATGYQACSRSVIRRLLQFVP